jgi:hypothetical protein
MDQAAYMVSLTDEITCIKDRIRHFIGDAHWQTDGLWKESILRTVLRRYLPPTLSVSSGFIVGRSGVSPQIDVLISDNTGPILFRDGEFIIVTPNQVRAAIEVKTRVKAHDLEELFSKLHRTAGLLAEGASGPRPFLGLFAFEDEKIDAQRVLDSLHDNDSEKNSSEPIDCISFGKSFFVRFWRFDPVSGQQPVHRWHAYRIENLAAAYFVHNVIDHLFPYSIFDQAALYPQDGKEVHKVAQKERRFRPLLR